MAGASTSMRGRRWESPVTVNTSESDSELASGLEPTADVEPFTKIRTWRTSNSGEYSEPMTRAINATSVRATSRIRSRCSPCSRRTWIQRLAKRGSILGRWRAECSAPRRGPPAASSEAGSPPRGGDIGGVRVAGGRGARGTQIFVLVVITLCLMLRVGRESRSISPPYAGRRRGLGPLRRAPTPSTLERRRPNRRCRLG